MSFLDCRFILSQKIPSAPFHRDICVWSPFHMPPLRSSSHPVGCFMDVWVLHVSSGRQLNREWNLDCMLVWGRCCGGDHFLAAILPQPNSAILEKEKFEAQRTNRFWNVERQMSALLVAERRNLPNPLFPGPRPSRALVQSMFDFPFSRSSSFFLITTQALN